MYYEKWLKYREDPLNIKKAREQYEHITSFKNPKSIIDLNDFLLGFFVDEQYVTETKDKYVENINIYDINNCVTLDFPLIEQCNLIQKYMVPYTYYHNTPANTLPYDINKLIYRLWPQYITKIYGEHLRTYPHNSIYEALYTIKEKLKAMSSIDIDNAQKYTYCNFELLGFIPLIGKKSDEVLMHVIKGYYNDAQEYIMFALQQKNPHTFYQNLKKILIYWNQNDRIGYSSGSTGMKWEVQALLDEYKKAGYNLLEDPDLSFLKEDFE